MMTSYARTNGIPNTISPLVNYIKQLVPMPNSLLTYNDNTSEKKFQALGAYGNGYERAYSPYRIDQILWQAFAGNTGMIRERISPNDIQDNHIALIEAVQSGKYGVEADDFIEIAKAQVMNLIRNGVFNERDDNNLPKDYPFADKIWQNAGGASAGSTYNFTLPEYQEIALQAAQQSVVLLKNQDGILPLAKDAEFVVAGGLADTRYKTMYSAATPTGTNMGLSPLGGIAAVSGKDVLALDYTSAGKVIKIKADNGKYLSVAADNSVTASGETTEDGTEFEVYPWGQADSVSLRIVNCPLTEQNGRWLQNGAAVSTATSGNFEVSGMASGFATEKGKGILRREYQPDGRVRYVGDCTNLYTQETQYYGQGRYVNLTDPATGKLGQTNVLGSAPGAASFEESAESFRTDSTLFTEEVIKEAGAEVRDDSEYAVVVIAASMHSADEGTDRIDMDLGKEQYDLVENVAEKYLGKTVVILKANSPVLMKEIQNNPNVAAIVYQPYAGQYDGYALGQVLFGDYAPTGKTYLYMVCRRECASYGN